MERRLIVVTRLDQLKVADVIVDLDCHCKRVHYATIVSVSRALKNVRDPDEDVFELMPNCCGDRSDPESITAINARIIRENRIYLVLGEVDAAVDVEMAELSEA